MAGRSTARASTARWWSVFGVLLILVGATAGVGVAASTSEERSDAYAGDVTMLRVDNGAGRVVVQAADVDQVQVRRTAEWRLQEPTEEITVDGGELVVTSRCGDTNGWMWLFTSCKIDYDIQVPRGLAVDARSGTGRLKVTGTQGPVSVDSGAGRVEITGAQGRVTARSGAGRVSIADVTGTSVDAHSRAGAVMLSRIGAEVDVRARSDAGAVELRDVTSPVLSARSNAGAVTVRTTGPFEELLAESNAGAVEVAVPQDGGPYQVDAGSSAGRVTVGVPTDPESGPRISASSGAGAVDVTSG